MKVLNEGLTKKQVKYIIKLSKRKELVGRTDLQGFVWEAESKTLSNSDGYYAVSWDLSKLCDEVLPKEDGLISYQKLNSWQVNASSKDILKWEELLAMIGTNIKVPAISKVLDKATTCKANEEEAHLFDASIVGIVMEILETSMVSGCLCKQYMNTTPILKLRSGDGLIPITALVMGVKVS